MLEDVPREFILTDFNSHVDGRVKEVDAALQVISTATFWRLEHEVILCSVIHRLRQPRVKH